MLIIITYMMSILYRMPCRAWVLGIAGSLVVSTLAAQIPPDADTLPSAPQAQTLWNDIYSKEQMKFRSEASKFVQRIAEGNPSGRALDLGMGTGRNALYLSSIGWQVTGVDVSDVAVAKAAESAKRHGVRLQAVREDLNTFDFGQSEWDLIVLSYMQFWVANAPSQKLVQITSALRPGGLLLIEGFAQEDAPGGSRMGFAPNALLHMFLPHLDVLEYTDAREETDWKLGTRNRVMRLLARRPVKMDAAGSHP
jgi:SAM-dependent methyltransferase